MKINPFVEETLRMQINVVDRNCKVLPDINITSTLKGYLNIFGVLFTQGLSSQIQIVRKFNINSKYVFETLKI